MRRRWTPLFEGRGAGHREVRGARDSGSSPPASALEKRRHQRRPHEPPGRDRRDAGGDGLSHPGIRGSPCWRTERPPFGVSVKAGMAQWLAIHEAGGGRSRDVRTRRRAALESSQPKLGLHYRVDWPGPDSSSYGEPAAFRRGEPPAFYFSHSANIGRVGDAEIPAPFSGSPRLPVVRFSDS